MPHATSREDKAYGWNDCGGADVRGTLAILRRVSDRREEGLQPSLLGTGRQRVASLRTSWSQLGGG
jgi:hypothetical protein